ncbi:MAG: AraC family transcriptional regulator [Bacteroidales bacterium]|nr:AraC family transcriptional regulator [Bacteroidales bacterium]
MILIPSFGEEKEHAIDSLTNILSEDSIGKLQLSMREKADIWNSLAGLYKCLDYDKARECGINALNYAIASNYGTGEGHAYTVLGNLYANKGLYDKALQYQLLAIEIRKEENDSLWLARNYSNIALVYDYKGDYKKSLEYYIKSLRIKEKLKDYNGIVVTLNNIGAVYYFLGKYEDALKIHFQAIEIEKNISDTTGLVYSYYNIGEIFLKQDKLYKAEEALLRSIDLNKCQQDNYIQALNYGILGTVYQKLGRNKDALKYLQASLELNEKLYEVDAIVLSNLQLGRFYYETGNLNKSIEYFNTSYNWAREAGYKSGVTDAANEISKTLKAMGKYSQALDYMQIYAYTRDSMYTEESSRQIEEMKTKYETEKKEQEIQIKNLQLAKNEETINKKNIALGASFGGVFLFFLFIILIYLQYRKKSKAYKHLVRQNLEAVKYERMREMRGLSSKKEIMDKYQKSALNDTQKNEMISKLIDLLEKERIYRDYNLNIDELAEKLKTNRSYLSQTINEYFKQNFNSMVNEYRIKEARQLLTSKEFKHLSIEGIARQVGFNSKSSFNTAFKNFTGLTPSYYLNSVKLSQAVISN